MRDSQSVEMLDMQGAADLLGVLKATVYTYRSQGIFPPPDLVDGKDLRWHPSTLAAWAASRPGLGAPGRPKGPSPRKGLPGKRTPIAERFWPKVHKTNSCWLWTASTYPNGYGVIGGGGRDGGTRLAHRVAYELAIGPIPDGMQLDHLCRNRRCVRPDHLQPVDARTNLLRAPRTMTARNAAKTHCIHGHPFAGQNLAIYQGTRVCLTCRKIRNDRGTSKRRAQRAS